MKFVSHLDMNRYITRFIKISKIPAWHTEGFNKHLYVTFALPLSLGITTDYDVFDLKITDDNFSNQSVFEALSKNATEGIKIISVDEPHMKTAELKYAQYSLTYKDKSNDLLAELEGMFYKKFIPVTKKGKKNKTTEINLANKIKRVQTKLLDGELNVKILLPAGNDENINPSLFTQAFSDFGFAKPEVCKINRDMLFNEKLEMFK